MTKLDMADLIHELCDRLEEYIPDPGRHPAHDQDRARVAEIRRLLEEFENPPPHRGDRG